MHHGYTGCVSGTRCVSGCRLGKPIGWAEHDEKAKGNPIGWKFWFNSGLFWSACLKASYDKARMPHTAIWNWKRPSPLFLFLPWNVEKVYAKSLELSFKSAKSFQLLRGHIPLRHPLSAPRDLTPFSPIYDSFGIRSWGRYDIFNIIIYKLID